MWLLQRLVLGLGLTVRLSPQAAARHQCTYLVGLHMGEFLQAGGNPAWLQGLHCAPQKLRNLNEINKLLAHRPWLITKEHIEVGDPKMRSWGWGVGGPGGATSLPGFRPFGAISQVGGWGRGGGGWEHVVYTGSTSQMPSHLHRGMWGHRS